MVDVRGNLFPEIEFVLVDQRTTHVIPPKDMCYPKKLQVIRCDLLLDRKTREQILKDSYVLVAARNVLSKCVVMAWFHQFAVRFEKNTRKGHIYADNETFYQTRCEALSSSRMTQKSKCATDQYALLILSLCSLNTIKWHRLESVL